MVVAVPLVVLAVLIDLPWWPAILIGLAAGVVVVWRAIAQAPSRLLTSLGDPSPVDHPRLENLVEGLSLTAGLTEPDLLMVDDPALNALTVSGGDTTALVVTSGLLQHLDLMQLEGVVAELLVRIKDGDAERATVGASLVGPLLDGLLAGLLGAVGARSLSSAFDSDRDLLADMAAASLTRYPPALGSALREIEARGHQPANASRRNGHLWLASPLGDDAVVPSSPLEWRIDMLMEI